MKKPPPQHACPACWHTCSFHSSLRGCIMQNCHCKLNPTDNCDFITCGGMMCRCGNARKKVRIAAAAIRIGQMTYALPAPARHHTVMWWLCGYDGAGVQHAENTVYRHMRYPHEQGFITSQGMFVDRETARAIAVKAQQLLPQQSGLRELFSEDVW